MRKVVQILLDAGADVNTQEGRYDNALQAVSYNGHEKVVQILLDAGAKVNAKGGEYSSTLQATSISGWYTVHVQTSTVLMQLHIIDQPIRPRFLSDHQPLMISP